MLFETRRWLVEIGHSNWIIGLGTFVACLILLFAAKRLTFALIRHAFRSRWPWLDRMLSALSPAVSIVIVVVAIAIAAMAGSIPPRWHDTIDVILTAGVVLALIIFFDRMMLVWMRQAAVRFPILGEDYSLVTGVLRGIVIGLGLIMFLESVGISVSPILASLGIGSLAIALALQETVKNMFAGFFVIIDKPLEVGDFVKLQSGQEGWLIKLGWRSSKFRMLNESIVVVPNSLLIDSIVTNYRAIDGGIAVPIDLSVVSGSNLMQVENVTLEVARDVMRTIKGGAPDYQPAVYFQMVSPGAIGLTTSLRAVSGAAIETVRHEFIKRLMARYQSEGIKIP